MRQLRWMADGKQRADWDRTSTLLAMYLNAHISRKTYSPAELNPFRAAISGETATPTATKEQTRMALQAMARIYERK